MLRRPAAGLTLLEILVVLALMALVGSVVAPRAFSTLQAAEVRSAERQLKDFLEALPLRAYQQGKSLVLDDRTLREGLGSRWPSPLAVRMERPLRYAETGASEGGRVQLMENGVVLRQWQVQAVTGRVIAVDKP